MVDDSEVTCPEGKYLNILTGRCKKIESDTTTACKEGYYRNPETGRCKKQEAEKQAAECADGYERNPETNRCRKIRTSSDVDYAVEPTAETSERPNTKVFIGGIVLAVLLILAIAFTIFQFRREIAKFFRRIWQRIRKSSA